MSIPSGQDPAAGRSEVTGVFKSAGVSLQKLNQATHSAVSDIPVERAGEEDAYAHSPVLAPGEDVPTLSPATQAVSDPARQAEQAADELRASMAKVDAAVQSIEARQAELEASCQKAEALLADVSRVSAALNVNDDLRKRIEATTRRTHALRANLEK